LKPETRATLLIFAIAVIWKMGLFITGLDTSFLGKYPLLLVFALLLIGMYRGTDGRRKLDHKDGIAFMPAFRSAMSVSMLFSLIYTLFVYFYITTIDDQFMNKFIANRVTELRASNTPEVDVNAWIKGAQEFPFALTWTLFTFIGVMVISVFYAGAIGRMMIKKYPKLST
jgi:hypothetical protein